MERVIMRESKVTRKTRETDIEISIIIEGSGVIDIDTGIGFFDHILSSFAKHGFFDLMIKAKGDLEVDDHHLIEDTGILLGQAIKKALGDKRGINRFGYAKIPMDESIAEVALDIDDRGFCKYQVKFIREMIGSMSTDMIKHFFESFSRNSGITIHITADGENDHHKAEAIFKSFGIALSKAVEMDTRIDGYRSTK
nr:imidazoleglycerol-phosphate dehydratase HisB [Candidatus Methanoliparum sp. LAM-1]